MIEYDIVIGLEVHAELKTKTKCFCACPNAFGNIPNTNTCPVCLGLPGALPVVNKAAIELCVKAGLVTNCEISKLSVFERKNYFYPDTSKAYQISQLEKPLCQHGHIDIMLNGVEKHIRINRIHLEEDSGKLVHNDLGKGSLVDFNRGGVPLIEVVSEPDISSADEAVEYLKELRNVLVFAGVTDGKMQEGSLRCDVNLSVKPKGSEKLGTRTEMKNLNSFSAAKRAILFETARQISILNKGGVIFQETRRWNDELGESLTLRSKENSQDYRYFPDPDLLPLKLSESFIENVKKSIPTLPKARIKHYTTVLGLPEYDANQIASYKLISDFFEETLKYFKNAKTASNWIMSDIMRKAKPSVDGEIEILISVENFSNLLKLVENSTISVTAGRTVFDEVWGGNESVEAVIARLGLKQVSDESEIEKTCEELIEKNQQSVKDFNAGNGRAMQFLMGQVMKAGGGKYNPQIVQKVLLEMLNKK